LVDFRGAVADFTKAKTIVPDYARGYYYRGISKYDLKDYEGAIHDFMKAMETKIILRVSLRPRVSCPRVNIF